MSAAIHRQFQFKFCLAIHFPGIEACASSLLTFGWSAIYLRGCTWCCEQQSGILSMSRVAAAKGMLACCRNITDQDDDAMACGMHPICALQCLPEAFSQSRGLGSMVEEGSVLCSCCWPPTGMSLGAVNCCQDDLGSATEANVDLSAFAIAVLPANAHLCCVT